MAKGDRLLVSKHERIWCETMRNPRLVLDTLRRVANESPNYIFDKLYRNLYNPEFYLMAYGRIYASQGNMTAGSDGQTIDGFSLDKIDRVIELMKSEQYQPNPARREYIPKKKGGKRPLGIPSFYDKVVQEVIRSILEHIYEDSFSKQSHGFRPNRSCHTALREIYQQCRGTKWWVEGDIKGFFDNIDHQVLIDILRRRIKDEKFLRLIWKFLKAGYLEDWKFHNSYSGTPQGGIVSPLLANIYLNELDKYMEMYKTNFVKGTKRKDNKEYKNLKYQISTLKKKILDQNLSGEEIVTLKAKMRELGLKRTSIDSLDQMDENFKRLTYVRYADDFLIGVIGSKEDAEKTKADIKEFLDNKLKLTLSEEKTLITHHDKPARFLGFDIYVSDGKSKSVRKVIRTDGTTVRSTSGLIMLSMPHEAVRDFMLKNGYIKIDENGNWYPVERGKFLANDDLEIVSIYNSEIRGFYNYYSMAGNVYKLNRPYWLIKQSFLKTLATKYKSKTSKMAKKFSFEGKLGIPFKNSKGLTQFREFYNEGFPKSNKFSTDPFVDIHVNTLLYSAVTSLEDRLKANKCEWCGITEGKFEVHHVRKLKDLKGKKQWEQFMIARNRKTMVMCLDCHDKLHAGKLD